MKSKTPPSHGFGATSPLFIAAFAVGILGVLIRLVGLRGDFWLDEVWSWQLALAAKSIPGIFFELKHDSNHFLTTLVFYLLGPALNEWVYRIPSLIASIGGLVFAYLIGVRYSRAIAFGFVALLSFSYPFIHYATEARGYSFMFFFSLAAFYCALRMAEKKATGEQMPEGAYFWSLAFGFSCIFGFLSHLSFLYTYLGLMGWLVYRRPGLKPLANQLLLPTVFLVFLYFTNIRGIKVGGAPDAEFFVSFYEILSLALGFYWFHWVAIPVFLVITLWSIVRADWQHGELGFFLGMAAAPFLVWIFSPETPPYPRHFLPIVLFSFLPISISLARTFRKKWRTTQWILAASLCLWVLGNFLSFSDLVRYGRGGYSAALQRMLSEHPGAPVSVSSDHDFRNSAMLDFYVKRTRGGRSLRYIPRERAVMDDIPDWVILHDFDRNPAPNTQIGDSNSNIFRLENVYRSSYLSGWNWSLYKHAGQMDRNVAGENPTGGDRPSSAKD